MFAKFRAAPGHNTLPRCTNCNSVLRAHVLWFDESYHGHDSYGLDLVRNAVCGDPKAAKLPHPPSDIPTAMVFIGTSFSVGITDMLVRSAIEDAIPMVVIDPHMVKPPLSEMDLIKEASEAFLPALVDALG